MMGLRREGEEEGETRKEGKQGLYTIIELYGWKIRAANRGNDIEYEVQSIVLALLILDMR